jgi:hypothetical protein
MNLCAGVDNRGWVDGHNRLAVYESGSLGIWDSVLGDRLIRPLSGSSTN